jgi:hypothetical protein
LIWPLHLLKPGSATERSNVKTNARRSSSLYNAICGSKEEKDKAKEGKKKEKKKKEKKKEKRWGLT